MVDELIIRQTHFPKMEDSFVLGHWEVGFRAAD